MKTNCWLVLGAMLASSAIAQDNTNSLPAIPAPVASPAAEMAPAPAATETAAPVVAPVKHKKRAAAHMKAAALKEPTVALVAGPAEVTVSNLIVRGQAGLKGEAVSHLFLGDAVTVLSQINLDKHAADEPAQWAKIACPTNTHIWVRAEFIDATNNVVLPKKLNLRAGPGENYSVLGIIERGTPVSETVIKDGWMEIETPASTYAFVAAMYLKQEATAVETNSNAAPTADTNAAPMEAAPAPTPTPVPEAQPIVTEETNAPAATDTNPPPAVETPAPEPAVVDTNVPPPPPRIATHEGVVRHVGSLITPTEYELYDPATDVDVDFLYTTTTNLDLSRYVGMRIIVTGEEGLAERWPDVPVLTIQRILVIDTNAVPQLIYRSPKASGQRH
jgi:uncharacterized protein YgiM (DUF1202 family)